MNFYRKWDERSLQQMTPKREEILLKGWDKLSRFGYPRFGLIFLVGWIIFSALFVVADRFVSIPIPARSDSVIAQIQTRFELTMVTTFFCFGLLMSLMVYFSYKMWAIKIANWKVAGRL